MCYFFFLNHITPFGNPLCILFQIFFNSPRLPSLFKKPEKTELEEN